MPRLPPDLLWKAYRISPLLPLVLRGCRTLPEAVNELRWLREHVQETSSSKDRRLLQLCERRARGEPLQYILGSQPFGDLNIKCRPGVLIPRPETEAYTIHLAGILNGKVSNLPWVQSILSTKKSRRPTLRLLDACSGSGCIALLLHSLLSHEYPNLDITGVDISDTAISLANENMRQNIHQGNLNGSAYQQVHFRHRDVLVQGEVTDDLGGFDVIVSNPPYISAAAFNLETSRSVRGWEPKLALVPPTTFQSGKSAPEDIFYERLLDMHEKLKSKVLIMEVGDIQQAIRVAEMATKKQPELCTRRQLQVWRDWPAGHLKVEEEELEIGMKFQFIGSGKVRAVVLLSEEALRPRDLTSTDLD